MRARPVRARQAGGVLVTVVLGLVFLTATALMLNRAGLPPGAANRADAAALVARAGQAHAHWLLGLGRCTGDLSIPPTGLGEHTYSATVTAGASAVEQVFVPTQTTWIDEQNPAAYNDHEPVLRVAGVDGGRRMALLGFDLSAITPGAKVQTARLRLTASAVDPGAEVTVHRAGAAWTAAGTHWANGFELPESTALATLPPIDAPGDLEPVVLTSLVQQWVNQPGTNFGLALRTEGTLTETVFASPRAADAALRPVLVVVVSEQAMTPVAVQISASAGGHTRVLPEPERIAYQAATHVVSFAGERHGIDAEIRSDAVAKNAGDKNHLNVDAQHRSLLYFDLRSIAADVMIERAELRLYADAGTVAGGTVAGHRILASWVEDEVTWNSRDASNGWVSPGGDVELTPFARVAAPGPNAYAELDLTALARAWRSDPQSNHGVMLLAESGAVAQWASSDHGQTEWHPRLVLRLRCECATACRFPRAGGEVLMVVDDAGALTGGELAMHAQLEAWGYRPTLLSDSASASAFASALGNADVTYLSAEASGTEAGPKLRASSVGLVSARGIAADDLGFASTNDHVIATHLDNTDIAHPLTAFFPAAGVRLKLGASRMARPAGTLAGGLTTLGLAGAGAAFGVIDSDGALQGGGTAPARRVMLALGDDAGENQVLTSADARALTQRALEWVSSSVTSVCTEGEARDEFEAVSYANEDGTLPWSGPWAEVDDGTGSPGAGALRIESGRLRVGSPGGGGSTAIVRVLDLDKSVEVKLLYRYAVSSANDLGQDVIVVEVSSDGSTWSEVNRFSTHAPGSNGVHAHDIGGFASKSTHIRLRIESGFEGASEAVFFDDVSVVSRCEVRELGLVAHWPLDEGSGTTARDVEGGFDLGLSTSARWGEGFIDGGLAFEPPDFASLANDEGRLAMSGSFTLSSWIYSRKLEGGHAIVLRATASEQYNYWLGTEDDELSLQWTNGNQVFTTSGLGLRTARWYHVAGVFDANAREVRLYVDGEEVLRRTPSVTPNTDHGPFIILSGDYPNRYWEGSLDDVRIYRSALSGDEILEIYGDATSPEVPPAPLPARLPGCEGTFLDTFETKGYEGSHGTIEWSAPWTEVNESNGPSAGDEQVVSYADGFRARVRDNDGGAEGIERQLDLAPYASARLRLRYWRRSLDVSTDYVSVLISTDGGAKFDEVDRFAGPGTDEDGVPREADIDLTGYTGKAVVLRLQSSPTLGGSDSVLFDDIEIGVSGCR